MKINSRIASFPDEDVLKKIYFVRGKKVMLDEDLADLYGVSTGNLNKAIKRNSARFPVDFMFLLTKIEFDNLIFQFGISSWGGRRKLPNAFTEQGVAMLSGILHSERAIKVNIQIILPDVLKKFLEFVHMFIRVIYVNLLIHKSTIQRMKFIHE